MAMATKMVAAAKQAEEQIRLDIGDDISELDDEVRQRPTPVSIPQYNPNKSVSTPCTPQECLPYYPL